MPRTAPRHRAAPVSKAIKPTRAVLAIGTAPFLVAAGTPAPTTGSHDVIHVHTVPVAKTTDPITDILPNTEIHVPDTAEVSFATPTLTTVDSSEFEHTQQVAREEAANRASREAAQRSSTWSATVSTARSTPAPKAAEPVAPETSPTPTGKHRATEVAETTVIPTVSSAGTPQAVSQAKKYLGIPYKYGGTNPDIGLDCSGLTRLVFADLGITLPRTAHEQATMGSATSNPVPGDLVFFGHPAYHVGIYVGGGQMIAAPHTGDVVKIEAVWSSTAYYRHIG